MSTKSKNGRHFGRKVSHFGKDLHGHEVKIFGNTTGKYFQWDNVNNELNVSGDFNPTGYIGKEVIIDGLVDIADNPNYDNSAIINAAIAAAPHGAVLKITKAVKANIEILRSNITLKMYRGNTTYGVYVYPYDTSKPALSVGNGSTLVENIVLEDINIYGTKNEADSSSHGLKINGALRCIINNAKIDGMGGDNVHMTSGTRSTSYIFYNNLISVNCRKSAFYVEYGSNYVTSTYLNNCGIQGHTATNAKAMYIGTSVLLHMNNAWIHVSADDKGIHNYGSLVLTNVDIDSDDSSWTLAKSYGSTRPTIRGLFSMDGYHKNSADLKHRISGSFFISYKSTLFAPVVLGQIYLNEYDPSTADEYAASEDYKISRSGDRITITADGKGCYWDGGDENFKATNFTAGTTSAAGTATFYGATSGKKFTWDGATDTLKLDGQLTVGVNDTGYDVKLFGATAGKYWLWDESADSMIVVGGTMFSGQVTVGEDGIGHDVIFYGDTAGCNAMWDQSEDQFKITGPADVPGLRLAGEGSFSPAAFAAEGLAWADGGAPAFVADQKYLIIDYAGTLYRIPVFANA